MNQCKNPNLWPQQTTSTQFIVRSRAQHSRQSPPSLVLPGSRPLTRYGSGCAPLAERHGGEENDRRDADQGLMVQPTQIRKGNERGEYRSPSRWRRRGLRRGRRGRHGPTRCTAPPHHALPQPHAGVDGDVGVWVGGGDEGGMAA
jgi:hypothetical protein